MSSEVQKMIVRNIDQESLLEAIIDRVDVVDIIEKFRYHEDFAPREYLTVEEFQKYIKCCRNYALALAKFGDESKEFHVNKVGRKWLIDRLSYERFIARGGKF
ncbi:Helix-turn-helix domain-containing protein [Terrisporobacter glycolicus]|nr:Helix-turn-helix domain-containing protein [Terrisporobacter glycolicus]